MSESLAELLIRSGLVTPAGLAAARAEAARTRKRLAECVIDLGLVDERRFAETLAQATDASLVDPIPDDAAAAVRHHVPSAIARELQAVPLRVLDRQLFVVMVNPLDGEAIDLLHAVTTRTIHPMTGVRSEIARLVNHLYPDSAAADEEEAPFQFSNETLLRRPPELDFLRDPGAFSGDDAFATIAPRSVDFLRQPAQPQPDEEFGTMIARPADRDFDTAPPVRPEEPQPADDATAPTNPIVAIERRLDQIVGLIRNIEKRLDRLESLFHDREAAKR